MPLAEIRSSIARNCAKYADDPVASTSAADLIITLRRTTTAVQRMMEAEARTYDLSPSAVIILMALAAADGRTLGQAEIGRQLAVSLGSLTSLVRSLASAGFVSRSVATGDRRVSSVALSAKGVAFVKRFAPVHYRNEAAAIAVLTAREQRTLLALLDKLRDGINDVED